MTPPPPRSTLFPYTTLFRSPESLPTATDSLADCIRRNARPNSSYRSEEHTSELQSLRHLVCRLLLEKKKYMFGFQRIGALAWPAADARARGYVVRGVPVRTL